MHGIISFTDFRFHICYAGVMCFCHYVNTSNPDSLGR